MPGDAARIDITEISRQPAAHPDSRAWRRRAGPRPENGGGGAAIVAVGARNDAGPTGLPGPPDRVHCTIMSNSQKSTR